MIPNSVWRGSFPVIHWHFRWPCIGWRSARLREDPRKEKKNVVATANRKWTGALTLLPQVSAAASKSTQEGILKRGAEGSPHAGWGGPGSWRTTWDRVQGWKLIKGTSSAYNLFIKKGGSPHKKQPKSPALEDSYRKEWLTGRRLWRGTNMDRDSEMAQKWMGEVKLGSWNSGVSEGGRLDGTWWQDKGWLGNGVADCFSAINPIWISLSYSLHGWDVHVLPKCAIN